MRIKGSGNVGIGTASPAYPLDVRADQAVGRFLSTNAAEISVLVLGNTAATARWFGAINFNNSSGGTQGQISYATNTGLTFDAGGAERLRITPSGGVGIGTTDPAGAALNVAGTVRATQFQGGGASLTGIIPADNSVTSPKILNGAILNADLADNSVNAAKIADGSVTSLKIADGAVTAVDLASEETSLNKVSGGHLTVTPAGNVGLGTSVPGFPLNFASATGDKISLYGTSANHYGFGIQSGLLQVHGPTASGDIAFGYGSSTNFTEQMRIKGNGNVGIGTAAPAYPLDVRADQAVGRFLSTNAAEISVLVLGNSAASARSLGAINFNGTSGTPGQIAYATNNGLTFNAGGAERLRITPAGSVVLNKGNGTAGVTLQAQDSNGDSRITAQVIEITGGSDLSERFEVKPTALAPAPGMVVCIDPDHPGQLAVSTRAYDRTTAGVISGAGGVKTGLLMGQNGSIANGQHPVALSGRVYCWVDANYGAVQPGDLITTSDTPGHGMKVADQTKAQGAILGKAMTPLGAGQGLVLVLVTLQ
jgi:hypothetical protein